MEIKVKDIRIKAIPAAMANNFVKRWHYSGKVVPNSQLHFGAFYNDILHGVMSFGASINKKDTINLVAGTGWNEFIELNRMAFDDYLPKNSESRCLAIALKLIKKHAPHIKWVISFADATQCGHGTIYMASGFKLVGIAKNTSLRTNPKTGENIHVIQAHHLKITNQWKTWQAIPGYQLKYIYFMDKTLESKLTVPVIPFGEIKKRGIAMYKGQPTT